MPDSSDRKRIGDRKDGRLLRSLDNYQKMQPYVLPDQTGAAGFYSGSISREIPEKWLKARREKGYPDMDLLHLFVAAYVRTAAHCPGVNRFVAGQKIYARNNIDVVIPLRRRMSMEAQEVAVKFRLAPTDTVFDVYHKLRAGIDEFRADDWFAPAERLAEGFGVLPGVVLKFALWVVRVLDYFDWLPQAFLEADPFHASLYIEETATLGAGPLYTIPRPRGSLPFYITYGIRNDRIEYGFTVDRRIESGIYFAGVFKYMDYYLNHPEALELPPRDIKDDVM